MSIALLKKNAVTLIAETAFYLMVGKPASVRSLYPVRFFAGGFQMRCFLLTASFLQSFTHRRKNDAAPYAERPLRQNPTMRNIAPIAEKNHKKAGGGKDEKKEVACYEIEALNALQNLTI